MAAGYLVALTVPVTIEFVLGIVLNLHILLVYTGNLKNGVSLGLSDRVHLTKALVNVFLHGMMTAKCLLSVFWPYLILVNNILPGIIMITITSFIFYNYWLMAVLCIYYCTSITTCGHHILVWLKRSLSSYLLPILLVSGLGSFLMSLPLFWFSSLETPENITNQSIAIQTAYHENVPYKAASSILGCFLPFTIALVSTTFTSWSLINHMWRLRQNNQGFTCSKFRAQINATRTMILFLLISVIYSVTQVAFVTVSLNVSEDLKPVAWLIMTSFPISEAIIIIQSSVRLRSALLGYIGDRKRRNIEAEL
ncbi:taste receptor type 2 member 40-like [Dendropsophus ebraccatus]|uniref:taste receptor type 2 member 40-like n=1 Tax=Dendropsophus ebraccatus TaxID=150705 RepID=UPI0038316B0A